MRWILALLPVLTSCATIFGESEKERYPYFPPADVRLGMSPNMVRELWGEPKEVLTAGTDYSGNQKWVYKNPGATLEPSETLRVIYFEKNRVVGWTRGQND